MGNCSASDGDVSDKNNSSPENLPSPAIEIDPFFIAPKLWQPAPLPSLHFSQAEEDFVHKTTPRERGASQVPALVVDQSKEPKSVLEVLGRGSIDVGMVKQSKLDAPPMGDSAPKIVKRAKPWELLEFATTKDLLCFGGGSLLALAQGSCNPLISLLLGDGLNVAFDPFFTGSVEEELREVVYKLFGVLLLMFVTAAGWQALLIYSAERQCAQMRKDYFATLCKQDTAWFDLNDIAGLPNKMASEVMTIKEAVGVKYGLILLTVGNIMSGLITGAFKQFQTFMVCLAFVPPITAIGLFLSFTVGNSTKFQQKCFAKAGSAVEEILAAIRTVCAFGGEQQACDRFEAALDEALIGGVWGGLNMGLAMGGMIGTMQMMAPATFLYGAHEILNEADADQGSMVAAFSAIYLGLGSLQTVGDPLLACLKAMLCAAAMFDTMRNIGKIEAEELDPVPPQILHSVDRIEYEQVWFHYPSRPDVMILKGVDLSIVAGDKVAFCGGSGSGKSTIIQLLLRFYDPLSGVVRINGVDLKELPVRHYRRTIGYVGQEPILFATTVMENIKGGNMSFSDEECIAAARQAEAFDFLDQLPQKFHTFVGIGGGAMSGGQKQRVAIARALIKKPQVLLLDEATSALDNESEKMVQNTIDGLQKHAQEGEHKLTTLAIAHRLSTIRNSNKIICLQLGMIVEQGDHEHLMAKQGDYYGLVKAQEGNPAPPKAAAPNLTQLNYSIKKRVSAVGSGSSVSQPKEDSGFLQKAARRASQTMQNVAVQLASAEMQEEHAQMVEELTNPAIDVNKRLTAMIDHKGVMVIAFVCSVFAGAVMPINALVLTHMMETMFLIDKDEMQREMHVWVSIMGFNAAVAFLAELGKYSAFAYIAETLTMKLRCQFFRSIVRTEIGFFDDPQNAPAGISAMLSSMCGQVTKMIGMSLGNICHAFLSFFIGALLAMFGSWRLNLVILGTAPFLLFAMFIVVKMTSPSEGNDPWAPTYEVATETILNMRTVKALVSEEHSIQIFGTCIDKILLSEIKSCWKKGFAFGIGNSVIHIPQIIAFTYGAWLIDDGLESQKMFQTLYCLVFGVLSAGHASAFAPGMVEGKLAALLAFQIIDRESKCDAMKPDGLHEDLGDGSFSLEHVMFFYPHRPELVILKDMNLIVEHGRSVAYCGPSGCGKSTVIQLAMRFYDPSGGIVRVGGTNLKEFNVCWWRKQVGLVGQEPILFDMSIYENVRYGKPSATSLEVDAMGKKADMGFILNGQKVWSDGVGPRGSRLSGGQKQRVAIARALIRNPSFLLLDEATSALDSASEHAVQQALDRAKTGRTTMSIAHRLSTIMDCDPIFICKGGYVIERGNHEDLIALEGVYYTLAKLAGAV